MNKLYRSKDNKMISGVFGGLGEFFNLDPNILRIVGLLLFFGNPFSFLFFYFLAAIIIPVDQGIIYQEDSSYKSNDNTRIFIGLSLILVGAYLLIEKLFPAFSFNFLASIRSILARITRFWPILLIILGLYILVNNDKEK